MTIERVPPSSRQLARSCGNFQLLASRQYSSVEPRASLIEILSALSCALDLVEGQPEGHAIRTAAFAQRLGAEAGLGESQLRSLVLAALLKDTGCSASSAKVHQIFGGDDHLARSVVKFMDWSSKRRVLQSSIRYLEPGSRWSGWFRRVSRGLSWPKQVMVEIGDARRRHGAEAAAELGCSGEVAQAIRCLDEHWDGLGVPKGIAGEAIPLNARILGLAQVFDVFATRFGMTVGFAILNERAGRWFDPMLVRACDAFSYNRDFWNYYHELLQGGARRLPGFSDDPAVQPDELDLVCRVFARIIDAKSSYSAGHSTRVAEMAGAIARQVDLSPEAGREVRLAAMLHDIGKLGVPYQVLDKSERLLPSEAAAFRSQVRYTQMVLQPIKGFENISRIAFAHHDGMDGAGFWRGLSAGDLDLEQQVLAASDAFDALVSERPYKRAMTPREAVEALHRSSEGLLDPRILASIEGVFRRQSRVA